MQILQRHASLQEQLALRGVRLYMCVCVSVSLSVHVCVQWSDCVSVDRGVHNPQYSMECFFHDNGKPYFVSVLHLLLFAGRPLLSSNVRISERVHCDDVPNELHLSLYKHFQHVRNAFTTAQEIWRRRGNV